jgi:hypothetical protein
MWTGCVWMAWKADRRPGLAGLWGLPGAVVAVGLWGLLEAGLFQSLRQPGTGAMDYVAVCPLMLIACWMPVIAIVLIGRFSGTVKGWRDRRRLRPR